MTSSEILHDWLLSEKPFRFAGGHVFASPACLSSAIDNMSPDAKIGRWECDLLQVDRLTWSEAVYDMFGFQRGQSVQREEAVARYRDSSRELMERLRDYAIRQRHAFVLDAGIDPGGGGMPRWMRLITIPIESDGNIVALKGLKVWL